MTQSADAAASALLGAADVRRLADSIGTRPTKTLGQNFVVDANTVRRIVRLSGVGADDVVLEVGPGLGSLTLALLPVARRVIAVEIDPALAHALPRTVSERLPSCSGRLTAVTGDALRLAPDELDAPDVLVANLPYNVAVPVVLRLLEILPSLRTGLVMVQAEVADRLIAPPGSRTYGIPSAKLAWYADASRAGSVARTVFWPVPNVDSGLVRIQRRPAPFPGVAREDVFAVIDAAFAQRRKTLRSALADWAGSPDRAADVVTLAGIAPTARGEQLAVSDFAAIAAAAYRSRSWSSPKDTP